MTAVLQTVSTDASLGFHIVEDVLSEKFYSCEIELSNQADDTCETEDLLKLLI